jgi:hypothetical protein
MSDYSDRVWFQEMMQLMTLDDDGAHDLVMI